MQITTVDQLVAYLRRRRIAFHLDELDRVRATTVCDCTGEPACPLAAPIRKRFARENMFADRAAEAHLGLAVDVGMAVMEAADNHRTHNKEIRQKLLTLVEEAT